MSYSDGQIWMIIVIMGVATYLIRFSFLGLIGDRELPEWALRHLRYTPVAVLPGLVAPLVLAKDASGQMDPTLILAAITTVTVGWWRKGMFPGVAAGVGTYLILGALF
ncbi:MAG: AzlD domain-containing protein [Boseongicola sp.]|nr:AzlD domain-containing protein [Boseongicola sp.]NNL19564.1 AzlD domain-containing protein [Boseongicola sp.]